MIVTGAFFAEAASVADNKLYVLGGALTRWHVGDDRMISPVLVVLTQSEPNDNQTTLPIDVHFGTDPNVMHLDLEIPEVTRTGQDGGFFLTNVRMQLPYDGRYVFQIAGTVSLPIAVVAQR
ncbi:hypothetical protein EF294_15765 [Gordonia oryzae]|uniref:YtkA-like domain-containing protein n=1 Tax=Gordonia oryzae TaxID=2487349 RepID=A0A3N4G798_9ACTN|nr:hypothetical protein [Gordonia oryzae]RPA58612.1 hypothetical protein EF294_15765 [Gordonia oryzae]